VLDEKESEFLLSATDSSLQAVDVGIHCFFSKRRRD